METMRSVIGTLMTVHPHDANGTKRILFFRGYYAAECNAAFPVVRAVTTYTFSIRIGTVVWPCQISIIGCPFRPTDGYSRNDVVTNKSASMLLPGKIAGQSVYLLDDTDIEITILVHVNIRNKYRCRRYRRTLMHGDGICILFTNTICRLFKFTERGLDMTFAF